MAKAEEQQMDVEFKGMPGADLVSEEEAESFQVNLNFDNPETEEVEFPKDEEEVVEETLEAKEEPEAELEAETEAEEAKTEEEPELEAKEEVVEVEAEAEEAEPEKPKPPMVPKSRLDEVLAKNKKLQKQIDTQTEQETEKKAEAPKYDFDTKEQEYQQLVLDGEAKKATGLRTEIRKAEKEQVLFEVKQETGKDIAQDRQAQELQAKATEIAEVFPILDENSESFDQELAKEIVELRDAFIVQGYDPADSLAKATDVTLTMNRPELLQADGIPTSRKITKTVAEKRQKTTVQKKLVAAKAQPPNLKGEGTSKRGDSALDLNVLSDEEFGALPEDTLRRMRGDFG